MSQIVIAHCEKMLNNMGSALMVRETFYYYYSSIIVMLLQGPCGKYIGIN